MKFLLLNLDYFSPKPILYFKSRSGYKTIFGIIVTLISFVIIFCFLLYYFISFIQGNEFYIATSKENKFEGKIDLSDSIFLYRLLFSNKTVVPPTILRVVPQLAISTPTKVGQELIKTQQCNKSVNYPGEEYNKILNFDISPYTCFTKNQNLTIMNIKEPENVMQYFNFYIAKCTNDTSNVVCASTEEIDNVLKRNTIFFDFVTESSGIDHKSNKHPIFKHFQDYRIPVSNSFFYLSYLYFRKLIYTSDDGIFFEINHEYDSFTFEMESIVTTMHPFGTFQTAVKDTLMILQFGLREDYAEKYSRTFSKFQTFLANVGGLSNLVMIIAELIEFLGSRQLMYVGICEESAKRLSTLERKRLSLGNQQNLGQQLLNRDSFQNPSKNISLSVYSKFNSNSRCFIAQNEKACTTNRNRIRKNQINRCHTIIYQLFICKRNKSYSKFKFLSECEAHVKSTLSCEEILARSEITKKYITSNIDNYSRTTEFISVLNINKNSKKIKNETFSSMMPQYIDKSFEGKSFEGLQGEKKSDK